MIEKILLNSLILLLSISVIAVFGDIKQVNVVLRHGDRTPGNFIRSIPNDPHRNNNFYPMGRGGLTNAGKLRVYNLGKFLRTRYIDLLGPVYLVNDVEAVSSDSPRARMSLQMALAGLYPPSPIQQWFTKVHWQPVLTSFKPMHEDKIFVPQLCEEYQKEYENITNAADFKEKMETLKFFMEELAIDMGRNSTVSVRDMNDLYHTLVAEKSMNLPLPTWAENIFPDGKLRDGAILQYLHYGYNEKLKRLSGGVLLQKIIQDMKSVQSMDKRSSKMHIYSGHELNIVMLLNTLGLYNDLIPEYSSAVIIELHEIELSYYVKVLYHKGIPAEIQELSIPNCEELCLFEKFIKLLVNVTATESDLECKRLKILPE